MSEDELIQSLNMNTINDENGNRHLMSVPLTQDVSAADVKRLSGQPTVAVTWNDQLLALIEQPEFYPNRKEEISTKTFGTRSVKHKRIAKIEQQGDFLISGKSMTFTKRVTYNDGLNAYRKTPEEIRSIAAERKADALYAF